MPFINTEVVNGQKLQIRSNDGRIFHSKEYHKEFTGPGDYQIGKSHNCQDVKAQTDIPAYSFRFNRLILSRK